MGRKHKQETRQKTSRVYVWLTDAEHQEIIRRAGQLPVSQYCRSVLTKGRPPKQPPIIPEPNWEAYRELHKHLQVLSRLSRQFAEHTKDEQAQALTRHAVLIKKMLDDYRISLITLQQQRGKP